MRSSFLKVRGSVAGVKGGLTQSSIGSAYQQVTGYQHGQPARLWHGKLVSSYDGPSYTNQNTAAFASYYNGTPSVNYSNTLADPNLKPYNPRVL